MLKHKYIDRICAAVMMLAVIVALLFINGEALGITPASSVPGYESRLFDSSIVHQVDLIVDDWDSFLASADEEKYIPCTIIIDGEAFSNVGLRAKGNNSLRLTKRYGLDRYSLKVEFDHYEPIYTPPY